MRTAFRKSFARDLKKVKDRAVLDRVRAVIEQVEKASEASAIGDLRKLSGVEDAYRIRVGEYRRGVTIADDPVEFVRCLPRRDHSKFFP